MIAKTVYTFTVLHPADAPLDDLGHALYEASEGNAVGDVTAETTVTLVPDAVRSELIALGNDGEFFDSYDLEAS